MVNSRQKGKVGEREWARVCRDEGYSARRGQQYSGSSESPDVVSDDLPDIHFEVKRTEKLRLYDAVNQGKGDAREGQLVAVPHRRNRHDWVVIMPADDWFRLVRESEFG